MTVPGGVGARLVCQGDRHEARLQHQGLAGAPLSRRPVPPPVGSQITLHSLGRFDWLFTADSHASAPSLFSQVTALPNRTDGGSRPEASVPGFSPGYGRNCRDIAEADDQTTDVGVVGSIRRGESTEAVDVAVVHAEGRGD